MREFYLKRGFTLIEVIISIAILGIIAVSVMSVFGTGARTIFSMGHRTQAVSEARSIIDTITNADDTSEAFIQSIDGTTTYEKIVDCSQLTLGTPQYRVRYCLENQSFLVNGKNATQEVISVLVYYNNNTNYVVLSAVIP